MAPRHTRDEHDKSLPRSPRSEDSFGSMLTFLRNEAVRLISQRLGIGRIVHQSHRFVKSAWPRWHKIQNRFRQKTSQNPAFLDIWGLRSCPVKIGPTRSKIGEDRNEDELGRERCSVWVDARPRD